VAEDQLDGHGEAAVGAARQALHEAAPAAPAGQGPPAAAGHVHGADCTQITHQPCDVGIRDCDAVDVQDRLGQPQSAGCVLLGNLDIIELFEQVRVNDPVLIVD